MVASDSALASQAGLEILRAGGNAFDAAAAVSFALAVTRPESTGLGGGGFLLARLGTDPPGSDFVAWDFRETAPAAAAPDLYVEGIRRALPAQVRTVAAPSEARPSGGGFRASVRTASSQARLGLENQYGNTEPERVAPAPPPTPPPSQFGHLAVAVPGLVAGRVQMLEAYGTRSLAEVLAPAIRLAREGFPVDAAYVEACRETLKCYEQYPQLKETCEFVYRVHLRNGDLRAVGSQLVQPELAALLEALATGDADFFYRGPVAEAIEREMSAHGGILRAADLAAYRVVTNRQPIVTRYRNYTVVGMPPPSGGLCVAETLNILETADLAQMNRDDPNLARHWLIEAMKHAFADRARWLGDPAFVPVPVNLLTSDAYARQLAAGIDPLRSQDLDTYGADQLPDDAGTSHFCVVDRWGNCVVSTETINTSFGSLAAVPEWGLILNNEMDDFAAVPGEANAFGLIQSQRNAVAAGKRPLSSMSPTIVLRGDQPCLLLGGSGGPRIISAVLNVLVGVLDFGLPLDQAVRAPRVHHQWKPDEVSTDAKTGDALLAPLSARGHHVHPGRTVGVVQAIQLDPARLLGVSDPRKGGAPAGY